MYFEFIYPYYLLIYYQEFTKIMKMLGYISIYMIHCNDSKRYIWTVRTHGNEQILFQI